MAFTQTDDFLSQASAALLLQAGDRPDPDGLCQAMDQVFALAEQTWQARRTSLDYLLSAPKVACRAGCGWCCHQQVGISIPEAIRIARHMADLPPEQAQPLLHRLHMVNGQVQGMTTSQRARAQIPCAFLGVDGACRIYEVRPLRCRGLHSIDEDFCKASCQDPDAMAQKLAQGQLSPAFLTVPEAIFDSALSGLLAAAKRQKWTMIALELTGAVAALIQDGGLARKWLKGVKPARALGLRADG